VRRIGWLVAAGLGLLPAPAQAFFQYDGETLQLELRGNARFNQALGRSAAVSGLPDAYTPDRELSASFGMLRLMADATVGEHLAFELHVFQLFSGAPAAGLSGLADGFGAQEAGRTGALSWPWYARGGTRAELAVDRAAVKAYLPFGRLVVGRQPVNFATTYFFTPNDFFQAFSAQTFFRVYKAGVDAARLDVDLGELSQLTVVGVLGYRDLDRDDRIERPGWHESSTLARISATFWDFEWSALGGKAPHAWVAGIGLQGEVLEWLGVRVEGHVAIPQQAELRKRVELAVGLEHRFESSLYLRFEYFYNGSGRSDPDEYGWVLSDPVALNGAPYLGQHYATLGASYELTALLTVDAFGLVNATDGSFQVAAAFAYSLLDDVDLSVVLSLPVGEGITATVREDLSGVDYRLGSELGASPIAVSAEVRAFF